ncbi:MAG: hypothetical protein DWQ31_21490 [Planctomycetota bacterium]|nr:MAG: hypothetical protein DWQ31_21490 [Planctomycetota bacterium]REJ93678.1 MAG: hypothetical protein DWQ35_10025 [Planctomycetota bacterium]REK25727.1 MAG: hypothetical protein DWQ42_10765 [Planctomycetota bacterium]REK46527.1 MAG: hypothetical protein DWQ46_06540 [Planctomycetota bacterium]
MFPPDVQDDKQRLNFMVRVMKIPEEIATEILAVENGAPGDVQRTDQDGNPVTQPLWETPC